MAMKIAFQIINSFGSRQILSMDSQGLTLFLTKKADPNVSLVNRGVLTSNGLSMRPSNRSDGRRENCIYFSLIFQKDQGMLSYGK